jgi:hypothetical protein
VRLERAGKLKKVIHLIWNRRTIINYLKARCSTAVTVHTELPGRLLKQKCNYFKLLINTKYFCDYFLGGFILMQTNKNMHNAVACF